MVALHAERWPGFGVIAHPGFGGKCLNFSDPVANSIPKLGEGCLFYGCCGEEMS